MEQKPAHPLPRTDLLDCSLDAHRRQTEALIRMPPEDKIRQTFGMTEDMRRWKEVVEASGLPRSRS